jgi:hypothetical protein
LSSRPVLPVQCPVIRLPRPVSSRPVSAVCCPAVCCPALGVHCPASKRLVSAVGPVASVPSRVSPAVAWGPWRCGG